MVLFGVVRKTHGEQTDGNSGKYQDETFDGANGYPKPITGLGNGVLV